MSNKAQIALLVLIGLLVYSRTFFNPFVWDDEEFLVNNPMVHSIKNIPAFFVGQFQSYGGSSAQSGAYYRPLMATIYSTIYTAFGSNPFFFHLFQVAAHIVNAILVFVLFKKLFSDSSKDEAKEQVAEVEGLALALIFLVHPMNVEAVSFISATQEVLFLTAGILALLTVIPAKAGIHEISDNYIDSHFHGNDRGGNGNDKGGNRNDRGGNRNDRGGNGNDKGGNRNDRGGNGNDRGGNSIFEFRILLVFLLLVTSFLLKETGIIFAFIVLLYVVLFKRQRILPYLFVLALVVVLFFLLRFSFARVAVVTQGLFPIMRATTLERFLTIPSIVFFYLKTFFFPFDLAIAQHWVVKSVNLTDFVIPLVLSLGVLLGLLYCSSLSRTIYRKTSRLPADSAGRSKNNRVGLFFFFWLIIGLLPHLQLIPLNMTAAERWFYLPMVGMLGMIGTIISNIKNQNKVGVTSGVSKIIAITVIILFSFRSIIRVFDWKDGLTLYSRDIKIGRHTFDLENNLGVELFRSVEFEKAKVHFEKSVQLAPYWWVNWNNLGAVYERNDDLKRAEKHYEKAIENGDYYLAYENYVLILLKQEKFDQAKEFLEKKALQKFPKNDKLIQAYSYVSQKTSSP